MDYLAAFFTFLRDVSIFAASVGVALWAWDRRLHAATRANSSARSAMERERLEADTRQWQARMEAISEQVSLRLQAMAAAARDTERTGQLKLQIHALLQATRDPFLTFAELRDALTRSPDVVSHTAIADVGPAASDADIRGALIALVADRAVAQLDRDRYFIASDFEDDETDR